MSGDREMCMRKIPLWEVGKNLRQKPPKKTAKKTTKQRNLTLIVHKKCCFMCLLVWEMKKTKTDYNCVVSLCFPMIFVCGTRVRGKDTKWSKKKWNVDPKYGILNSTWFGGSIAKFSISGSCISEIQWGCKPRPRLR